MKTLEQLVAALVPGYTIIPAGSLDGSATSAWLGGGALVPVAVQPAATVTKLVAGMSLYLDYKGAYGLTAGGLTSVLAVARLFNTAGTIADLGNYVPAVAGVRVSASTISTFAGIMAGELVGGSFGVGHKSGAGTVSGKMVGVEISPAGFTAGGTVTGLVYGVRIANQGNAGWATSYGLYIDAQSGSTANAYAAIFEGGAVGMGTATPAYPLDVVGDVNTSASLRTGGVVRISNTGALSGVAVATPVATTDPANKAYVDASVSAAAGALGSQLYLAANYR